MNESEVPIWPFVLVGALLVPFLMCDQEPMRQGAETRETDAGNRQLDERPWIVIYNYLSVNGKFYEGKNVVTLGVVGAVRDNHFMLLADPDPEASVINCYFDGEVPKVRKCELVIVKGRCKGDSWFRRIDLDGCKLIFSGTPVTLGAKWRELEASPDYNH